MNHRWNCFTAHWLTIGARGEFLQFPTLFAGVWWQSFTPRGGGGEFHHRLCPLPLFSLSCLSPRIKEFAYVVVAWGDPMIQSPPPRPWYFTPLNFLSQHVSSSPRLAYSRTPVPIVFPNSDMAVAVRVQYQSDLFISMDSNGTASACALYNVHMISALGGGPPRADDKW